jgi:hypothetical protein
MNSLSRSLVLLHVLSMSACGAPPPGPEEAESPVLAGTVDGVAWWSNGPPSVTRNGGVLLLAGESLQGVRIRLLVRTREGVMRYGREEISASLSRGSAEVGREMHWPSPSEGELELVPAASGVAGRFRVVLAPDAWTSSRGGRLVVLEGRFSGP